MSDRQDPPLCPLVREGDSKVLCPAGLAVPVGAVLARRTLRSVAVLVIIGFLITAVNLLWTAHLMRDDNQGRCGTVVADATIPLPPPGSPGRDWDVAAEAIARQRSVQLGCH